MSQQIRLAIRDLQIAIKRDLQVLSSGDSSGSEEVESALSVLRLYDRLAGYLYRIRASFPGSDSFRQGFEDYIANLSHELVSFQKTKTDTFSYRNFVRKYRQIWREEFYLFLFPLFLFIGSGLLGWNIGVMHPELVPVLIPQSLMEQIIDHHSWFESIRKAPLLSGLTIAINNIKVSIMCFALGAVFGLGGLYILCMNAVFFGAITGYCYINGFNDQLTNFVVGHGILELTIIIASGFASLLYGRVFFMRPYRLFSKRFAAGAGRAMYVIGGVVPWLILAACIEAFVSPFSYLPLSQKILLGSTVAALFWLWTFFPDTRESEQKPY